MKGLRESGRSLLDDERIYRFLADGCVLGIAIISSLNPKSQICACQDGDTEEDALTSWSIDAAPILPLGRILLGPDSRMTSPSPTSCLVDLIHPPRRFDDSITVTWDFGKA